MSHNTAELIVILVVCALVAVVSMVVSDWANKQMRARSKNVYWRSRPTSLQLVGYFFVVMGVGFAAEATPPQWWPEWLRTFLFVAAMVVIYCGERILREFWPGGPL